MPSSILPFLPATFACKDASTPHDVAQAIVELVGQAKGSRAVRTVVGARFGSDKANEDVAPVQAKVVEALGLSHLEKPLPIAHRNERNSSCPIRQSFSFTARSETRPAGGRCSTGS